MLVHLLIIATAAASVAAASCAAPLLDPTHCCTLISPPLWKAQWTTTAGSFELLVNRSAAPLGVDRFYNLVYYGCAAAQRAPKTAPESTQL